MKHPLLHFIGLALALGLVLAGGVVHGLMVDRSKAVDVTGALVERMATFPESVGPWRLAEASEIDQRTLNILECEGYLSRTYVNPQNEVVKVALLLGPHGPISVHTPEICYSSRDYEIEKQREPVTVKTADGASDALWAVTMRSRDLHARRLRVYYGWTYDGLWQAAANPRFTFRGKPYLLKLQIAGQVPHGDDSVAADPCRRFLQEFTPQFRQQLFADDVNK